MFGFLFSRIGRWIAAALAVVAAIFTVFRLGKSAGKSEVITDSLKDKDKRMKEGRDAVSKLRGADRDALIEQLRRNDNQR